jgi:hypothetical protein
MRRAGSVSWAPYSPATVTFGFLIWVMRVLNGKTTSTAKVMDRGSGYIQPKYTLLYVFASSNS